MEGGKKRYGMVGYGYMVWSMSRQPGLPVTMFDRRFSTACFVRRLFAVSPRRATGCTVGIQIKGY